MSLIRPKYILIARYILTSVFIYSISRTIWTNLFLTAALVHIFKANFSWSTCIALFSIENTLLSLPFYLLASLQNPTTSSVFATEIAIYTLSVIEIVYLIGKRHKHGKPTYMDRSWIIFIIVGKTFTLLGIFQLNLLTTKNHPILYTTYLGRYLVFEVFFVLMTCLPRLSKTDDMIVMNRLFRTVNERRIDILSGFLVLYVSSLYVDIFLNKNTTLSFTYVYTISIVLLCVFLIYFCIAVLLRYRKNLSGTEENILPLYILPDP